jgi:hypothetical protein
VKVKGNGSELDIPPEEDGSIAISTIQAYFPHSSGLSFTDNGRTRCMRVTGDLISPPNHGWGDRVYHATFHESFSVRPRSSQPPAPSTNRLSQLCQAASASVQSTRLASAREEQSRLFRHGTGILERQLHNSIRTSSKRKKLRRLRPWRHDFVCLASANQKR